MNLNNKYKTNMLNKMKLIKTRNLKFKKICSKLYSKNIQYGGTGEDFSDDIKPITEIINFDIEIDNNNKLIEEYLEKLNSLHTIITKETPDISKEEFDKFAKELKVKEEGILAQKEKIETEIKSLKNQGLENTQQYKTSLQSLEQQNAGLNSTIQSITNQNTTLKQQLTKSSQTNTVALRQLQIENQQYKQKIANMTQLETQLLNLQQEKVALSEYTKNREEDIRNLDKQLESANLSLQGQASLNNEFKKLQSEKAALSEYTKNREEDIRNLNKELESANLSLQGQASLNNEFKKLQSENVTLKQENANLPEKIKIGLQESLQTYDKKLLEHVEQKENQKAQIGGQRLKNSQQSYRIYANRKNYERNLKKLSKIYNKIRILKNSVINKHMKIYVKKNNIKMTDIKKELKFLFENRSKYLNNQTIFMGGEISSSEVYNQVVSHLIKKTRLPDLHFDNIYNQLKQIIKGEVSDDSSKDILDQVYKAVLGDAYDINNTNQQKFLNKAMTIKMLGDEIIGLLTDCEPTGMDVKFKSEYEGIMKKTKVLDKLVKLLTNPDDDIRKKAFTYLPIDTPKNLILKGDVRHMTSSIQSYYTSEIDKYTNNFPNMLIELKNLIEKPWKKEENKDMKQELCKHISNLQTSFKKVSRELDLSYIVNKYEDISGAVRVYVRINDYAVKQNEKKQLQCSIDSLCLGRSYTIQKMNDEETTFILARNPCEQDAFYKSNQRDESIAKGKKGEAATYTVINPELLKKYNMLGVQRYGSFFGTYENVTNKDIFEGVPGKMNNPPLKDALLQATQGYSIILFGYGYSGSGKSWTLLNGNNSMLSSFMEAVKDQQGTITIDKISELYGRFRLTKGKRSYMTMQANEYSITEEQLKEENQDISFTDINNETKKIREDQIDILLKTIENLRKKSSRTGPIGPIPATVKGTPNNPASSRSHLFIRIGVKLPKGEQGFLTLVDMAGIENPIEIAISIFPFIDLRNLVHPFSSKTFWADIELSKFKNNTAAKNELLNYFHQVCLDLQRAEREICSWKASFTNKESDRDWKWIRDCNEGNYIQHQLPTSTDKKIDMMDGYPENIFFQLPLDPRPSGFKNVQMKNQWNAENNRRKTINKTVPRWKESNPEENKKKTMLKIKKKILTKGEAFAFLKDLKEVFYYTSGGCTNENKRMEINKVIDRWLKNLSKNSQSYEYIYKVRYLKIKSKTSSGEDDERQCKEIFTLLMNYCFSCMILNGIIQDYNDIEDGNIEYKNGDKKYLTGFLTGVTITYKDYLELVEEGIFINETINHLAFYFKKKNKPTHILDSNDQLKEIQTRMDATSYKRRDQRKKMEDGNYIDEWNTRINMTLKTYLTNKFIFNPNKNSENILIKGILNELDSKSGKGKPSKFIMMCLLRPEIDAKYCTGARATLDFAESVCSTCT